MKTCWLKETRLRLSPGSNINETLKKPSVSHGNKVQTWHYPFQLIRGLDKWGGDGSSRRLSKLSVGLQWLGLQKTLPRKRSVKGAITTPSSGLSWFCLQALQFSEMGKNTCS